MTVIGGAICCWEALEIPQVMPRVLLYMLEAVEGRLCVLEVMCRVLLCMLDALKVLDVVAREVAASAEDDGWQQSLEVARRPGSSEKVCRRLKALKAAGSPAGGRHQRL